jgi:hypothetical protein
LRIEGFRFRIFWPILYICSPFEQEHSTFLIPCSLFNCLPAEALAKAGSIFPGAFCAPKLSEGAVAQLVEQRTENPCVGGSIPPHTTNPENISGFFLRLFVFNVVSSALKRVL